MAYTVQYCDDMARGGPRLNCLSVGALRIGPNPGRCACCHGVIVQPARGRRRRYCGPACRQKAYRRRRAVKAAVMRNAGLSDYVALRWADYRKPLHPERAGRK